MIIVNIIGVGLIGLIVWWFWLYKSDGAETVKNQILVTVDNGVYTPARVKIKPNTSSILTFLRKDESPCAELVLLPALDISQTLPLNKKVSIELPPLDLGEYVFHCQMQMYRGMLIVE